MSGGKLVLDTDVVSDLLKKKPEVVARFLELVQQQCTFVLSPVVVAEVYAGAFEHEHKAIAAFFELCTPLNLDHEVGLVAGLYARRFQKAFQDISLEDYLLAATARGENNPGELDEENWFGVKRREVA